MHPNQKEGQRSEYELKKLSEEITVLLNKGRLTRLQEAIKDNDMLYLNCYTKNISSWILMKILFKKIQNRINVTLLKPTKNIILKKIHNANITKN